MRRHLLTGGFALLQRAVQPSARLAVRDARELALPAWTPLLRAFASLPQHTELTMPALSPTMAQGNLVTWSIKEGQEVAPGDAIAEVETDKATMTWENQDDGFVAKLLVPEGAQGIEVGAPVAILVEEQGDIAAFKDYAGPSSSHAGGGGGAGQGEAAAGRAQAVSGPTSDRLGPAARMLLSGSGLGPGDVTPTGPHGIVTKGDVLAALASGQAPRAASTATEGTEPAAKPAGKEGTEAAATAPAAKEAAKPASSAPAPAQDPAPASGRRRKTRGGHTDVPNSQIRRIIAARLSESKSTIPHLYLSADVDMDAVAALRAGLKTQGLKLSVNDFVVKAAAGALAAVPAANAHWDAGGARAVRDPGVDIAIAVATEAGLITPIVRGADAKSLPDVAEEVRELAARARRNRLKPEEFQGGSFSISNLGMYGIDSFSAIINPPQACIMAVGASRTVTVIGADGALATKSVMRVTLSADHRVYDGEIASDLLAAFKANLEAPFKLLL
ncbi:DLA3 [Auxenochlorella protothecoides x Auxenochlorella symbiontica]